MDEILISIIIPHYNDEHGLRRILNEIVACDKVEVIIVDDNSTCVSIDVFAEEYPSFIFAHNNSCAKGAGSARNIGIGIASGKYLAFFDSDDMIVPGGIQTLIEDAEGGDYDLIVYPPLSSLGLQRNKYSRVTRYSNLFVDNMSPKEITDRMLVPWSKLVRRSLVRKYRLAFDEVMVSNDIFFCACVSHFSTNIKKSNSSFYLVEENSEGLTKKRDKESLVTRVAMLNKLNDFYIGNGNYGSCNLKYVPLIRLAKVNFFSALLVSPSVLSIIGRWFFCVFKFKGKK